MREQFVRSRSSSLTAAIASTRGTAHWSPEASARMISLAAFVFVALLCGADARVSPAISVDKFLECSRLPPERRRVNVSASEEVRAPCGPVQGFTQRICEWETEVSSFMGIPYARPPVGELRFAPPQKAPKWRDVLNATKPANSCLQVSDEVSFGNHQGVRMWNVNSARSEDCLELNIWTPTLKRKIGVLVWIFGGSYNSGTIALGVYDGATFAALFDVVVVAVNYRLGPLGFMYLGTPDIPGNMGLMDQKFALQWVHDNIAYFGGLPDRVTIMGESSGSASIGLHLLIPESGRLFRSAIMLSGAPIAEWGWTPRETILDYSRQTARCAGCDMLEPGALRACLLAADATRLTQCQFSGVQVRHFLKMAFTPTQDALGFLSRDPHEALSDPVFLGNISKKHVLLGVTRNEGNYFLVNYVETRFHDYQREFPNRSLTRAEFDKYVATIYSDQRLLHNRCMLRAALDAFYVDRLSEPAGAGPAAGGPWPSVAFPVNSVPTGPSMLDYLDVLDDVLGETQFKCPMVAMANALSGAGWTMYFYSFEERSRYNPWPEWMGVLHGYEIEFLFGVPALSENYTELERRLSHRMMTAWTNFINIGDPNRNSGSVSLLPENAQWPPYSVREEGDLARRYFVLESGEEVPASTSAFSKSQSPSSSSSSTSYSSTQQLPVRIGSRLGHRTCYFLTQHLPRVLRETRCISSGDKATDAAATARSSVGFTAQAAFVLLTSLLSALFGIL